MELDLEQIVNELSLEEKAYLLSGKSIWEIRGVERLGIDSIIVTDGPHGIRKSENIHATDFNASTAEIAICYPTASALASSFNEELIYQMGEHLGNACQAMDVQVLLGPGNNIKRSPFCGRNFEYFSEDPYLAAKMATAEIKGIQSRGIGTSLKHFVGNNQEKRRSTVNAIIDERTLREIYLAAFEEPVIEGKPWTIMSAYNRLNGRYLSENSYLLKDILRGEWNYKGVILTDWIALDEAHVSILEGLDLEMPTSGDIGPQKIIKAVNKGILPIEEVDRAAKNVIRLTIRANDKKVENASYDLEEHHQKAREIAQECIVLLKNEDNILPLQADRSVAIIGQFAKRPRYQGGGSSHINPYKVETIYDEFKKLGDDFKISYADGYRLQTDEVEENIIDEAVTAAKSSDVVLLFVGLPDAYESEALDRNHLNMPPNHIELINRISKIHDNVVVVLSAGSVIKIPHLSRIKGLLNGLLTGEAGAGAMVEVLMGITNPSGKLSESFIADESEDPSFGNFPGNHEVNYAEGVFVGYRYHDREQTDLSYEFGYGLSYTEFEYSDLKVSKKSILDHENIEVEFTITNTGDRFGREIVQLYVGELNPIVKRPVKELKGFTKIGLQAGEGKNVCFTLDKRSFAYYNVDIKDWHVNSGKFRIMLGKSSRDIVLQEDIEITSSNPISHVTQQMVYVKLVEFKETNKIHRNTSLENIKNHFVGAIIYKSILKQAKEGLGLDDTVLSEDDPMLNPQMLFAMIDGMPLRSFVNATSGDAMTDGKLKFLIFILNLTRPDTILGKILGIFKRN